MERRHEILAVIALTAAILLGLALGSQGLSSNLVGPLGSQVASVVTSAFGIAAWLLPIEAALLAFRLFRQRPALLGVATMATTLVIVLTGCAILHLVTDGGVLFGSYRPGGAVGELFGEVLRSILGYTGSLIVCTAIVVTITVVRTPWTLREILSRFHGYASGGANKVVDGSHAIADAWRQARQLETDRASSPRIIGTDGVEVKPATSTKRKSVLPKVKPAGKKASSKKADDAPKFSAETPTPKKKTPRIKATTEPTIVAPKATRQAPEALTVPKRKARGAFKLPPTHLLDPVDHSDIEIDAETLRDNAERLTEKLAAYGVRGHVDEIHPGPVVTMYEFAPQSGTKVSKIAGLADDLAMALAAQKVRIVAPIPGKARVGFELPNDDRQKVFLREILEDRRWQQHSGSLPIALGKDIEGQPVYADLAKMPHLLVAGATGAGKSVGLNVMLASILSKKTPDEVRMLMIDPKVVELQAFDEIPHMLLPVVTDMKKAALALRWAVDEMERRYQLFADAGARNIGTFNKRVEKVQKGTLPLEKFLPRRKNKVKAVDADGKEVLLDPTDGERADALDIKPEKLPYVVVVVDEFADLMMVAAKDVEACVARLAQKARAAGIHVILATQRPSVDVITGMIKANFTARVAFKVSQRQDSMTILGRQGAEQLLGMGDMLMLPPGSSELTRVHAAYIGEDELKSVCDFLRDQGQPVYQTDILKPRDDEGGFGQSDDPLYDRAVQVVAEAGYCSISHVQRKLSVGYNKAAKLVERMEQQGVVGPPASKAGGRREVLIGPG